MQQNPTTMQRLPLLVAIVALSVTASFGLGVRLSGDVQTVDRTKAGDVLAGDMNDDGSVNRDDVKIILEIAQNNRAPTPKQLRADPNQDGKITVEDAMRILREMPST